MSNRPRSPRHRPDTTCARPRELDLAADDGAGRVFIPPTREPISLNSLGDMVSFVFGLRDFPIRRIVAVLLDEERIVVKMVSEFIDVDSGKLVHGAIREIVATPHRWAVVVDLSGLDLPHGDATADELEMLDAMRGVWADLFRGAERRSEVIDVIRYGSRSLRSLSVLIDDRSSWARSDPHDLDDNDLDDNGFDDAA